MGKILIDVNKNFDTSRAFTNGSLLVHDGKEFHRTSVRELYVELFNELNSFKAQIEAEVNKIDASNKDFYKKYTEQNAKLIPILEKILKEKQ